MQVLSLKSREASSENVLRVAKETLDARKKQIKTLTVALKTLQVLASHISVFQTWGGSIGYECQVVASDVNVG